MTQTELTESRIKHEKYPSYAVHSTPSSKFSSVFTLQSVVFKILRIQGLSYGPSCSNLSHMYCICSVLFAPIEPNGNETEKKIVQILDLKI